MSNPAESVSVLVESFKKVGYDDDGLRPYNAIRSPYGASFWYESESMSGKAYDSNSDDYGRITTGTGSSGAHVWYAKVNLSSLNIIDYNYVTVRAKANSNVSWICEAYDGSIYEPVGTGWRTGTNWETRTFYIANCTLGTITFGARTNNGSTGYAWFDYVVVHDATVPVTLTPSDVTADNVLTEGFASAELNVSYPEDTSKIPDVNDHIKIWMSKGNDIDYYKVFSGKIDTTRRIHKGKEHRWIECDCSGFGNYLSDRKWSGNISGTPTSVILEIVNDVIQSGKITAHSIQTSTDSVKVEIKEDEPVLDVLRNNVFSIEANGPDGGAGLDWDFYVDFGGDLHAFQKGIYTSTVNLANDMFQFDYEKTIDRLVNKQEIFGAYSKGYGGTVWTNSLDEWTACPTGSLTAFNSPQPGKGTVILSMIYGSNGQSMWVERTIPTTFLRAGGELKFDMLYSALLAQSTDAETISVNAYFFTDNSNYFVINNVQGGGISQTEYLSPIWIDGTVLPDITIPVPTVRNEKVWSWSWNTRNIPFGPMSREDYTTSGTPTWDSISKIRLEVDYPVAKSGSISSGYMSMLQVDNMTITTYYYGIYEDTLSQSTFGIKEGLTLSRPNLVTDAECTLASSLIVDAYKDPVERITNLEVSDNFGMTLGTEYTFNTLGINNTLNVRKVSQNLSNFNLSTQIDLAERYIPSPEVMMATFQRQLDAWGRDLDLWKRITSGKGVSPGRGLLDWWDVDPTLASYEWALGSVNKYGTEGITDDKLYFDNPGSAEYTIDVGNVQVTSGTVYFSAGMEGHSYIRPLPVVNPVAPISADHTICLGANIMMTHTSAVRGYVYCGAFNTSQSYFGFYIGNNLVYGWTWDDADEGISSIPIGTISSGIYYPCEAVVYPDSKIDFWFDKQYKGSISTYLPAGSLSIFTIGIKTYEDYIDKTLNVRNYKVGEVV